MAQQQPFTALFGALQRGEISRRDFLARAGALGMAASVALAVADAAALQASPEATPARSAIIGDPLPAVGTENQERGAGGELKLIQWQAPTTLNGLQSGGDKDGLAAQLVSESLMVRDTEGRLIPILVTEVPTLENGRLDPGLMSVTYTLIEDVVWSDGEPFTADDCAFTIAWAQDGANAATQQAGYRRVDHVDVTDDRTFTIFFTEPNPNWPETFTGSGTSVVLPKHVLDGAGQDVIDQFRVNPIGTGPYKVESFSPQDQVTYVINENYREPNKPFFSRVVLKGGGDAATAARAVLQTGEYDYCWNPNLEPSVLQSMLEGDPQGDVVVVGGLFIEHVNINFADPDTEVDGQRSEMNTPHPILADHAVRQAMALGIDRVAISNKLYLGQEKEPGIANILAGLPSMESSNTSVAYDPEAAARVLDEAGWVMDGEVRKKDGRELKLRFNTTVHAIRQKEQAMIKANLESIGFRVELQQTDSAVFFDSSAGNEQNNAHFYTDLEMFVSVVTAPPPLTYMRRWYAGKDRVNIAQKANGWTGENIARYVNEAYDALYEQAQVEPDPVTSAELFVQMNDLLINDVAVLPLIRQGKKGAISKRLNVTNLALNMLELEYYNIANWNLAE